MPRMHEQHADYVTCKHCQRDFRAITVRHLRNIHGYDGDHPINEYKTRFRLESATCLEVRKQISETKEDFWARRGQHWTRATLLAEIKRHHRAGRNLSRRQVPVRVYEAGRRLFGSWQTAVEKAGLNYVKVTGVRRWSAEKVIEEIHKLAERGVPLNATYIERRHSPLFRAAVKRFPFSWEKALRAAGIDPAQHKVTRGRWNAERAERWIRQRVARGRCILARSTPRELLEFVYKRLRSNWVTFVESFGIPYPGIKKRRDWTKEKLLSEMRRWKAEGHRMNYRAVKAEYQALIHQARKFFSSWDRACSAAFA